MLHVEIEGIQIHKKCWKWNEEWIHIVREKNFQLENFPYQRTDSVAVEFNKKITRKFTRAYE